MPRLHSSDYEAMLDLAVGVLRTHDSDELWRLVVRELLRALDAAVVVDKDVEWRPDSGPVRIWRPQGRTPQPRLSTATAPDDGALHRIRAGYPFAGHYMRVPHDRAPRTAAELAGEAVWLRSQTARVTREVFGTRHALGLPLTAPGGSGPVHGFIVHRDGRDFTDLERRYAARVQPLLSAAAAQRRLLARGRPAPDPAAGAGGADAPAPGAGVGGAAAPPAEYGLTPREHAVLLALAEGLPATAVARRLGISARTVHKHLQNLYRKLGAADRLSAVLRAQEAGLLRVPGPAAHGPGSGAEPCRAR
ncbi:helix-turn-helix transcriptional regulator [Streptomyces sp. MRC013]|uniref:helix-turn-helix transcriptional regulator n=1 Tax=Streptomyces sp. MRC013 TaxID=2898276 RepID=UPI0020265D29|nr:helix-turn-helix transcriptional regulator [Streptomyces sp. MRC013]URM88749.1 helix-turn-helix transcriptional regulator [Streptomyces sp. MRC013]